MDRPSDLFPGARIEQSQVARATGGARVVYEKRDEGHFASIYYIERRQERGKEPEDHVRRMVLTQLEALKLSHELREVFANAGVSNI